MDDDIINRLDKLAWYLAHKYRNDTAGHLVRLEVDDIHAELLAELVYAMRRYEGKPEKELLKIGRAVMYRRMKDLLAMEYGTYRKEALLDIDDVYLPFFDLHFNVLATDLLSRLEPIARAVAKVLLEGSDRMTLELVLADLRRSHVYKGGRYKLRPKPWMVARALGLTLEEVEEAYAEIVDAVLHR